MNDHSIRPLETGGSTMNKGCFARDRHARVDVYHFYRAHWSREPMVRIAGRRSMPRPAGPAAVKAYSNASCVTLAVNGVTFGTAIPHERIAVWRDVPLAPGRNVLSVSTDAGVTDSVVWQSAVASGPGTA